MRTVSDDFFNRQSPQRYGLAFRRPGLCRISDWVTGVCKLDFELKSDWRLRETRADLVKEEIRLLLGRFIRGEMGDRERNAR